MAQWQVENGWGHQAFDVGLYFLATATKWLTGYTFCKQSASDPDIDDKNAGVQAIIRAVDAPNAYQLSFGLPRVLRRQVVLRHGVPRTMSFAP
jgi:hypothetical protein